MLKNGVDVLNLDVFELQIALREADAYRRESFKEPRGLTAWDQTSPLDAVFAHESNDQKFESFHMECCLRCGGDNKQSELKLKADRGMYFWVCRGCL